MGDFAGAVPPERYELGRFESRYSFLYLERCIIHREDNAVTFADDRGVTHAPAASLAAIIAGPGTSISHAAMLLLGICGVSIVWVGEQGVRYYAHGRPLSGSSRMAEAQAKLVSNVRFRAGVARQMYKMRFGSDEDISSLSIAELRGKEGVRMRRVYREEARKNKVVWSKRDYDAGDFDSGDQINQALTAANAALYGVSHAAIVALGCVPSLGFIHRGTDRAFVFDIADLYKTEISIPIAFRIVGEGSDDISRDVRRAVRDVIVEKKLLKRIVRDITSLLQPDETQDEDDLQLWDEKGLVDAGVNYGDG